MGKKLISLNIIVLLGVNVFGCMEQKTPATKYEEAKNQAEVKIARLEEVLKPIKALQSGNFSGVSMDANRAKNVDMNEINKISAEVNEAMRKVFDLKPQGYDNDYNQWTQTMKQRLESIR